MISFYNSLTKKKEQFEPISDRKVKMYTCGPTVYDFSHIGNFRTFLFEDLLKRVFIAFGYEVDHVMNITDVDDKTIKKSVIEKKELKDMVNIILKMKLIIMLLKTMSIKYLMQIFLKIIKLK